MAEGREGEEPVFKWGKRGKPIPQWLGRLLADGNHPDTMDPQKAAIIGALIIAATGLIGALVVAAG